MAGSKKFLISSEVMDILYRSLNTAQSALTTGEFALALESLDELAQTYEDGSKEPQKK